MNARSEPPQIDILEGVNDQVRDMLLICISRYFCACLSVRLISFTGQGERAPCPIAVATDVYPPHST
jgi:hypothetical protein